jgi:anti-sigma B factor antagonist
MVSDFEQNGHHEQRGTTLECRTEVVSDCTVIHVSGEVDLATAPILEKALDSAIAARHPIIVDFAATRYIDSTGLHVLLQARRRHTRAVAAAGLPPTLRRVFELTNVDQTIPLYATVAEALSRICPASTSSEVAGS